MEGCGCAAACSKPVTWLQAGAELPPKEVVGLLRPQMVKPETLKGAIAALGKQGAMALAGATDLIPEMRQGLARPRLLVDLKHVPGLAGVRRVRGGVSIGALTKVADLLRSPVLAADWPVIVEVARDFGSPQVRNLATVGGNLCNATPSADLPLPLLVLEARLEIVGPAGERELPIADFFRDVNRTALGRGEILTAVVVPRPPIRTAAVCLKLVGRRAMDLAIAASAAAISLAPDGKTCRRARVAAGAVAPIPMRCRAAEALLQGKKLTPALLAEAAAAAAQETKPVSDLRASADYRREMTAVLTRRALAAAFERARKGGGR